MDSLGLKNVNAQRLHKTWQKGLVDVGILERVFSKKEATKRPAGADAEERGSVETDPLVSKAEQKDTNMAISENAAITPGALSKADGGNGIEWSQLNHGVLMHRMAAEICFLRADLKMSTGDVAEISGISEEKICAVERGEQNFSWTEYLSLLFLFWCDDRSRPLVVEKKLFPEELMDTISC